MSTLYCPTCGYNLTGLPENRCPECGNEFDPAEVWARQTKRQIKPIAMGELLLRLLWPPGAFLFSALLLITKNLEQFGIIALVVTGAIVVVYGPFNAYHLSRRLAVSATPNEETDEPPKKRWAGFVPLCCLGLYGCQLIIAAGGCAFCAATM